MHSDPTLISRLYEIKQVLQTTVEFTMRTGININYVNTRNKIKENEKEKKK